MIPLRDRNPSGTFPFVTIMLIVINALVFFYQLSLGDKLNTFLMHYALVPAKLFYYGEVPALSVGPVLLPFVTSMFFHGGWLHIVGNMWFLWIFGDNVEDRLGHARYLVFYLLCGIGAAVIHVLFNVRSTVPTVGASGAIAGVLGAYLISFPHARVLTAIPIFFFIQLVEIPAIFFLVFWFILQFFSGTLSLAATSQAESGGIAWWAHIGGFICGIVLITMFSRRRGFRNRARRV
jgi:membrane associated rhomboid family serine protease